MKMSALAQWCPIILAGTLLLTGCVSHAVISAESSTLRGVSAQNFTTGEVPVLVADAGFSPYEIRVRNASSGQIVRTSAFPSNAQYTATNSGFDPDEPATRWETTRRMPLRGLDAGNYVAEVWMKGEVKASIDFSVTGPSIANRGTLNAVERLDQLVGLTEEQRVEAGQIFRDEREKLDTFASIEDRAIKGADIRRAARAQIRTLLNPDQQKIYDETPQRLGGASMRDPSIHALGP